MGIMRKSTSGFTIVELLIVIVVIAILAAITIVAYNGIQARAKATSITTGFNQIDKSLRMYGVIQGWNAWPEDNDVLPSGESNPTLEQLVNDLPGFDQFMQQAPSTSDLPASAWFYDNDGDTKPACDSNNLGTNIVIEGVSETVADNVDSQLDDGDDDCGKIRYRGWDDKLYYTLSFDGKL